MMQPEFLNQTLRFFHEFIERGTEVVLAGHVGDGVMGDAAEQLEGPREARLTQDVLAARLGTVREVVARSLKELERSGAIKVNRGQIQVVDDERLLEWTQKP